MNSTQRRTKDALEQRLATLASDPTWFTTHVNVTTGKRSRMWLRWFGGVPLQQVKDLVDDVLTTTDPDGVLDVRFERTSLWACGRVHADAGAAFFAHEGADLLSHVTVAGPCEYCCDTEEVVDLQRMSEWIAEGRATASSCVRNESAVACPACGADGQLTDHTTLTVSPCGTCQGRGVFDISDPEQRRAAVDAHRQALQARRQAELDRTTARSRKRVLP